MGIVLLFILFLIYRKNHITCLMWMVVAYPTLTMFSVTNGMNAVTIMTMVFIADHIVNIRKYKFKEYRSWILVPTLLALISYLGSYFYTKDKHITSLLPYICDMLLIYLMWFHRENIKIQAFYKIVITYTSAICLYGIFEGLTGNNPILSLLRDLKQFNSLEQRADYVRFGFYRAQSLTVWCSIYGTVCTFGLWSLLYAYFNKLLKFNKILTFLGCMFLWGVLICGTRTVIAMAIIGCLSFTPYLHGKNKYILPTLLFLYIILIYTNNYFGQIVDAMLGEADVGGSSQEMRSQQLDAALTIYDNQLWGNGIGSLSDSLGENNGLLGAESIIFSTLIERGTVGIVCLIGFAISSIAYLYKKITYLVFFLIAFYFAKYNSLIPGLKEFYVLMYFMPIFYWNCKYNTAIDEKKVKKRNIIDYLCR